MNLKKGILIGTLITGAYALGVERIYNHINNTTDIKFPHEAWRSVGTDNLQIDQGQWFDIRSSCTDEDGLSAMVLYKNGVELESVGITGSMKIRRTLHGIRNEPPGQYTYRLVAIDTKGNQREDVGIVIVKP